MWVTISNVPVIPKYKMVAHSWTKRMAGKPMCSTCGLIKLKNPFTMWAVVKGCENDLHPAHKHQARQ